MLLALAATGVPSAGPAGWVREPFGVEADTSIHRRVLAVRTSWAEARDLLDELDRRLVTGVVGLVVLSAVLALAAAYAVSRRLGLTERTVRQIAEGDLTARVGDGARGHDEVAASARTIDALAASGQPVSGT